jgi:hypothetical protein
LEEQNVDPEDEGNPSETMGNMDKTLQHHCSPHFEMRYVNVTDNIKLVGKSTVGI